MAIAIRMPMPGQMTEECTVLQWFKKEGDTVVRGDPLFEIETDKSNMEIEAFDEGVLLRIDAPEGATVPVESIVAWIGMPGEDLPEAEAAAGAKPAAPAAGTTPPAAAQTASPQAPAAAPAAAEAPAAPGPSAPAPGGRIIISPRASRVAAELGVDPRTVAGTGPGGRIVERDVLAAAAALGGADAAPSTAAAAAAGIPAAGGIPAAAGIPEAEPAPAARVAPTLPVSAMSGTGETLSRMRQTIARRLTENTSVPTFTVTVAVDMTELLRLRADLKAIGSGITVTDFVHAATVQALGEFPVLNASTDGVTVWKHEHVHLGVAVSVPAGLLVPVVREADLLSVRGLHDRTLEVVEAARSGKLGPEALSGSTFSVSNMGMFGVEQFTAIINPGEAGILAVSSITPEVRPYADGLAVRQMMRITLTADHRLVDGELGARFVNGVKRRLEDADAFRSQVPTG
jgi:pyruvate dehydrogenase E2 component (dihydrolipoamide acetyltransferase)